LDAWIDFNADGDWDDPGERIFNQETVAAGTNILTFNVPANVMSGYSFARFRISRMGGLDHVGFAPDGEVEDYRVGLGTSWFNGITLEVLADGNRRAVIQWVGDAVLQRASAVTGPWEDALGSAGAALNSAEVLLPDGEPFAFFRLRSTSSQSRLR
jgi:hypothetical protein